MTINDITTENVGFVCGIFRERFLNITQKQFAKRHSISPAGVSYFERGVSMSFYAFLAYLHDGLLEHLDCVDADSVNSVVAKTPFRHRRIPLKEANSFIKT